MKLTYNNPAFLKGEDVELPGYGLVKNGESFEVTDEQAEAYEARTGRSLVDVAKSDGNFETPKGGK